MSKNRAAEDADKIADDEFASACRALWIAVIQRAIQDAVASKPSKCGSGHTTAREVHEARVWLLSGRDLREVCELAGLDPVAVREHAMRAIEADEAAAESRKENAA